MWPFKKKQLPRFQFKFGDVCPICGMGRLYIDPHATTIDGEPLCKWYCYTCGGKWLSAHRSKKEQA